MNLINKLLALIGLKVIKNNPLDVINLFKKKNDDLNYEIDYAKKCIKHYQTTLKEMELFMSVHGLLHEWYTIRTEEATNEEYN
tara:strand:+ start:192 stop:440 length:249 start_codon:yes stop_codon:yes gene_type:complete